MGMSDNIVDKENAKFKEVNSLTAVNVNLLNQLIPDQFDAIILLYNTSNNLTSSTFKVNGTGGTTVATLNLTYDTASNLVSVSKI